MQLEAANLGYLVYFQRKQLSDKDLFSLFFAQRLAAANNGQGAFSKETAARIVMMFKECERK